MRAIWERISPLMAGLAWSIPTAMWTGLIAGAMPANTPGLGLSLLIPAAVAITVMALIETRLTWPGRLLATLVGATPIVAMTLFGALDGPIAEMLLAITIPLAWIALVISLGAGHVPITRALRDAPGPVRSAPVVIWVLLSAVWIVIQASPDSALSQEGGFVEVQMLTIAGITAVSVLLVSLVLDRIGALRLRTTGAGRLR